MQPQQHSTEADGMLHLTPEDVKKLLDPAQAKEAKTEIGIKVADAYSAVILGEDERVVAEQIFRLLVRDTEVKLRAALSGRLKASKVLPRDIVLTMARDVEEVALPVLQYSDVLTDADLLDLIRANPDMQRHMAISRRASVSAHVSDALLDGEHAEVAKSLADNNGADLSEDALAQILDRYSANAAIMRAVANRSDLPVTIAEKVVAHVSDALSKGLIRKHKHAGSAIEREKETTREVTTISLLSRSLTHEELDRLVDQLIFFRRLTPSMLFASLGEGHLAFFEVAMARMADIPLANARKLLNDRGDLGFRAMYNKASLPNDLYAAARLLVLQVQQLVESRELTRGPQFSRVVIERMLGIAQREKISGVAELTTIIRRRGE